MNSGITGEKGDGREILSTGIRRKISKEIEGDMDNKKIAFITGGTSGIGAAFARRFACEGYDLIITGRRKTIIQTLAEDISNRYNVNVEVIIAELSRDNEVDLLVKKIEKNEDIEILVNNAGFGIGKVDEDVMKKRKDMVKVHILSTMKFTYAAIPNMIRKKSGIIINVSSIASFLPLPGNGVYSGTKAFLNNFSESIYLRLKDKGISVQCLCPGFTRTDFHSRIGYPEEELKNRGIVRWMSADEVVEYSMKCLKKNRVICIPGFWNRMIVLGLTILPKTLYYKIVNAVKT